MRRWGEICYPYSFHGVGDEKMTKQRLVTQIILSKRWVITRRRKSVWLLIPLCSQDEWYDDVEKGMTLFILFTEVMVRSCKNWLHIFFSSILWSTCTNSLLFAPGVRCRKLDVHCYGWYSHRNVIGLFLLYHFYSVELLSSAILSPWNRPLSSASALPLAKSTDLTERCFWGDIRIATINSCNYHHQKSADAYDQIF